jgi:hypothetical protein
MIRASAGAMLLVGLLASCDVDQETEPGCFLGGDLSTSDTLLSANIGGRQTVISPETAVYAVIRLDSVSDLHLRFSRRTMMGWESFQFDVNQFAGAGAYPINYRFDPRDVFAVYDCYAGVDHRSYWAYGYGSGDTMWVTTFDSATNAFEATFRFRGEDWDKNVEITDGVIRGVFSTAGGASP